ncbi:hypothetical protein RchiOBHm_Chr1g0368081 [Rosa chinensis]|uniref:Uncharacterized protein n=1 Tax=Rosa chinensis TaxID=74649 RepID=A0A2P6SKN3_ROSCH|nr:hypothetical protein RchiOBHm_Chr1g0368081 [Rosa chinensis]
MVRSDNYFGKNKIKWFCYGYPGTDSVSVSSGRFPKFRKWFGQD